MELYPDFSLSGRGTGWCSREVASRDGDRADGSVRPLLGSDASLSLRHVSPIQVKYRPGRFICPFRTMSKALVVLLRRFSRLRAILSDELDAIVKFVR